MIPPRQHLISRRLVATAVVALLFALPLATRVAAQQGTPPAGTPDATVQPTATSRSLSIATPKPASTATTEASPAASPVATVATAETAGGEHQQVIAQGLAIFELAPAVWRVTQITPQPDASASSFVPETASFTLQMAGASVIRNDVSAKRARLEPGEAYFMSAGDPYTRRAEGTAASSAWVIDLAAPDAANPTDGTVVYKSGAINEFPGGARDLELIRNVLLPGEEAPFPGHTGQALLIVTEGSVDVSAGTDATTVVPARGGFIVPGTATLRNSGSTPAVYLAVVIGEEVGDASAAAGATVATTPSATEASEPNDDPDGDGLTNDLETQQGSDPNNPDSDGDGLNDFSEYQYTNPANPDTDGDGITDGDEELVYGTDPNDPNSFP